MNNSFLSIIIPAYKEYDNLVSIIPKIISELQNHLCFKIYIIKDLSIDRKINKLKKKYDKYMEISTRYPSDSYGDAIRSGIKVISEDGYVVIMDADGSHDPSFIKKMLTKSKKNDVVIASRYIAGGKSDNKLFLVFLSKIVNLLYSKVLKFKCHDVSNSFRLYKSSQLKSIKLTCQHFDIVQEILFALNNKYNIKIKEIPYHFKKREHGESKRSLLIFATHYFFSIIKIYFKK